MEPIYVYATVCFVVLVILGSMLTAWAKRIERQSWESRVDLLNHGALICGKGEAALNADFSQCIFISEKRDLLLILRRRGKDIKRVYVQPYEVATVTTDPNPLELLGATTDIQRVALAHKMLTMKIADKNGPGFREEPFVFGDAQVCQEWKGKLEELARQAASGHTTLAHKL